jgi:hypothetical protein
MEYVTFSIRIPKTLCDLAEAEAEGEGLSRNHVITKALKERYKAHAPPITTIRTRPGSKSQNGRKSKTTIS